MINYNKLLDGKIAVITSGAHGMGKAIAKLYAMHGATCIINGRSDTGDKTAEMLRGYSKDSIFIKCDMSKEEDTKDFIKRANSHLGRVDIVVNNVGININQGLDEITDDGFEYTQQVNLHGVLRMARGFVPSMIKNGGGSFVNISTIHSVAGMSLFTSYASSKSAINAFSGAVAVEYGKYGIRSNIIAPGGVFTTEAEKYYESIKNDDQKLLGMGNSSGFYQPDYGGGSAIDIANVALYLASDMATHITGAVIMQDGGAHFQAHHFRNKKAPENSDELWIEFMKTRYDY